MVTSVKVESSACSFSSRSFLLPHKIRLNLWRAKSLAVASPNPEVAPVIKTILPVIPKINQTLAKVQQLLKQKVNCNGICINPLQGLPEFVCCISQHIEHTARKSDFRRKLEQRIV